MNETPRHDASARLTRSDAAATLLSDGAIFATVASAPMVRVTYLHVDEVVTSSNATMASGHVAISGRLALGDGGGTSACVGDLGLITTDTLKNCSHLADPACGVSNWGALCDVVTVDAVGIAHWTNGPAASANGTLSVANTPPPGPLVVTTITGPPVDITVFQIGTPGPAADLRRTARAAR